MVLTIGLSESWSFFSNRQQRTKSNNAFSRYSEIRHGVPQGLILGPFLISISATYFLTKSNAISQVMLTITHHIILVLI